MLLKGKEPLLNTVKSYLTQLTTRSISCILSAFFGWWVGFCVVLLRPFQCLQHSGIVCEYGDWFLARGKSLLCWHMPLHSWLGCRLVGQWVFFHPGVIAAPLAPLAPNLHLQHRRQTMLNTLSNKQIYIKGFYHGSNKSRHYSKFVDQQTVA